MQVMLCHGLCGSLANSSSVVINSKGKLIRGRHKKILNGCFFNSGRPYGALVLNGHLRLNNMCLVKVGIIVSTAVNIRLEMTLQFYPADT